MSQMKSLDELRNSLIASTQWKYCKGGPNDVWRAEDVVMNFANRVPLFTEYLMARYLEHYALMGRGNLAESPYSEMGNALFLCVYVYLL